MSTETKLDLLVVAIVLATVIAAAFDLFKGLS